MSHVSTEIIMEDVLHHNNDEVIEMIGQDQYKLLINEFVKLDWYQDIADIAIKYLGLVYKVLNPITALLPPQDNKCFIPLEQAKNTNNRLHIDIFKPGETVISGSSYTYCWKPFLAKFRINYYNKRPSLQHKYGLVKDDKFIHYSTWHTEYIPSNILIQIDTIGFIEIDKFWEVHNQILDWHTNTRTYIIGITTDGRLVYIRASLSLLSNKSVYIYSKLHALLFELQNKLIVINTN